MTGCKIGRIKFKSGGEMRLLPPPPAPREAWIYNTPWGRVTVESTNGDPLTFERGSFFLDAAKDQFWDENRE
jgi:hypothetical protein